MRARGGAAYRRLSESPLWAAQRGFYERAGIGAWRTGTVPHHVTSNVALATAYARVVLAFLRDTRGREPLYVVELGAGSGRFAFLFLRALEAMERRAPIRYVMTDVAESTLRFWRGHEGLRPLLDTGHVEIARFDADRDATLTLRSARRTFSHERPAGRMVVIANYVFGSLRQDAYRVHRGALCELLVAAHGGRRPADLALRWRRGRRVTAPYDDEAIDAVLSRYAQLRASRRLLFPVGALRCLDRLAMFAPDDLLVLVADRGTSEARTALLSAHDLEAARHGALSFPVGFHALRAWVAHRDGASLCPSAHRHVHVAAFLLGRLGREWPRTSRAYANAIGTGGPDAIYAARRALATRETIAPSALLSLMRRAGPDPRVVAECLRPLWPHLADADASLRRAIRRAVLAAWPNTYHLGERHDVAFDLALLLYAVRAYAEARSLFEASIRLHGDDAATWWNVGLCHVALGRARHAQAAFRRALRLAPGLVPAGPATVKVGRASHV